MIKHQLFFALSMLVLGADLYTMDKNGGGQADFGDSFATLTQSLTTDQRRALYAAMQSKAALKKDNSEVVHSYTQTGDFLGEFLRPQLTALLLPGVVVPQNKPLSFKEVQQQNAALLAKKDEQHAQELEQARQQLIHYSGLAFMGGVAVSVALLTSQST